MIGLADELSKLIDNAFKKANLTIVPPFVRYLLVILVIIAPCVGLILMVIFGGDDSNAEQGTAQKAAPTQASAPAAKSTAKVSPAGGKQKREKIE